MLKKRARTASSRPLSRWPWFVTSASRSLLVGLGASLLLAALLHYYTVLILAPFFLAELALVCFARQIRFKVWLALALPLVPIAVSWPRLMWMKQNWGPHFWAGAALSDVSAAYGAYFRVGPPWGMAICGLAILIILLPLVRRFSASGHSPFLQPALIAERVLIAGLTALPLFGFTVAKITHGPRKRLRVPCAGPATSRAKYRLLATHFDRPASQSYGKVGSLISRSQSALIYRSTVRSNFL